MILRHYPAQFKQDKTQDKIEYHSEGAYFFSIHKNDADSILKSALVMPNSFFIEKIENDKETHNDLNKIYSSNIPDLLLSLTTASCYNANVSDIVTECIDRRFYLNNFKFEEIKTCLQEAIMNALIHGNLQVGKDFRSAKDLYEYQTKVRKRLVIDGYRLRRLNIMVWKKNDYIQIAVGDEGDGFSIPDTPYDESLPSGRGFMLIRSMSDNMWVGEDRRTLFMTFNCLS
ncbi:MAG: ATP-binding protein [Rickettsiales bacterium]